MSIRTDRPRRLARRTVLATTATIGALGTAGCHREIERTPAGAAAPSPVVDPDQELLSSIRARLIRVARRVETTSETQPELTTRLAPLRAAHAAQLSEVEGVRRSDLSTFTDPGRSTLQVPRKAAKALAAVVRAERELHAALVTTAEAAASGRFARLMAVLAASVQQHLADLGSPLPDRAAASDLGRAPGPGEREALLDSMQQLLAGEHAALAVTAVLGARTSVSTQPALRSRLDTTWAVHRTRRDLLQETVSSWGADAVPAAPAYRIPGPDPTNPARIREAALTVESGCTALYANLVTRSTDALRSWAIGALCGSAVRELGFGGNPVAFPGAEELSNR